ncbi:tetratricopeptide repeat protein [Herbidospora mongoliensis]|uniref:tetratricopeptide repeat protein n=1 Tax=Herbidospora mongoliensis TaxID=688067 RepID=UPI0012FC1267|nr:tetratricopeptide repeat protein [Herbidospora mongoliensis]
MREPEENESDVHNEVNGTVAGSVVQAHTIHGGVVIHQVTADAGPRYRLEPMSPPPRRPVNELSLSQLLATRNGVVDFTGRDTERARLRRWRDDGAGLAALLVHGPGGQGKTRLAECFAAESRRAGWGVTAVRHVGEARQGRTGSWDAGSAGVLAVVDYAERWPLEDLLGLAADLSPHPGARLLLVARSSPWWAGTRHEFANLGFEVGEMRLGSLAATPPERRALFEQARDRFAEVLGVRDPERVHGPADLADEAFGLVLAVHMAALAAVDAHARGERAPEDPAELSAYLLDREHAYWQRLHGGGRARTRPETMGRTVFTAILTRPLGYQTATSILDRAGVTSSAEPAAVVLEDHRNCYPPADAGTVLEPLYPDRLAEDFVAVLTPGHRTDGYEPDAWAATMPARLLTDDQQPPPPGVVRSALTMLTEAARRWPHLAHRQLAPLLRERPQLAVEAGGAVLAALADVPELDPDVLQAIDDVLPVGRIDLDVGIAALATRVAENQIATAIGPVSLSRSYAVLADRLTAAGRYTEALAAARQAVELRRELAAVFPLFLPDLARSEMGLGACLGRLGQYEQALVATRESQRIYQALADDQPEAFQPGLAMALDHHGIWLSKSSRHHEALVVTEQAVLLYRGLPRTELGAYQVGLAQSLQNLAVQLTELGHHDRALTATRESIHLWRELRESQPQLYQPELALALSNLGGTLHMLRRHGEGVDAAREATACYRILVEANPAAFRPELARALHNFGNLLSEVGRHEQALAAIREAVEIRHGLSQTRRRDFTLELAGSLDCLAAELSLLGDHDQATDVARQAVLIHREFAGSADGRPGLAGALVRLSATFSKGGADRQALFAAREAVALYRVLAAADPAAFQTQLAASLNSLGNRFTALGRWEAALPELEEAVEIGRRLGADTGFVGPLGNLAVCLRALGEMERALSAAQETVQIYRRLADAEPHAYRSVLARQLSDLGLWLVPFGRLEETRTASEEAVRLYRSLAQADPAVYEPHLARALHLLGVWLMGLGHWQRACTSLDEAIRLRRELARDHPPEFQAALAESLEILAHVQRVLSPDTP